MAKVVRTVRIDPALWDDARVKAQAAGSVIGDVIAAGLRAYVADVPPGTVERVTPAPPGAPDRVTVADPGPDRVTPGPDRVTPATGAHRARCPHPGTRVIGGWCTPCGAMVETGGYLPGC